MAENRIDERVLREVIERSWSKETCQEPDKWTTENIAAGQCVPTALVVQDFLGGKIIRLDLSKSKNQTVAEVRSHYFNEIDGKRVDFSEKQFKWLLGEVRLLLKSPKNVSECERENLLESKCNSSRYLILRSAVLKNLEKTGEKKA